MFIWQQVLLVVGFWTIMAIATWLPVSYVLRKLDKRPKDAPRCRHCGYDLRASSGEQCPECGKPFSPRGVWPIGQPSRGPAINLIACHTWLCVSATFSAQIVYSEFRYEALQQRALAVDLAVCVNPGSDTFDLVAINTGGRSWQWFPKKNETRLRPTQTTIVVERYEPDQLVGIVTFDPKTMRAVEPVTDAIRHDTYSTYGSTNPFNGQAVTPEMLAGLIGGLDDPALRDQVEKEMAQVLSLSAALSDRGMITTSSNLSTEALDAAIAQTSPILLFERIKASKWQDTSTAYLPAWVDFVPVSIGFIAWLAGTVWLRRYSYHRMAVDQIPTSEQRTSST